MYFLYLIILWNRIDFILGIEDGITHYFVFTSNCIQHLVCQPNCQQFLFVNLKEFRHDRNLATLCRCNNPCSSRSSFIFFPNIIILNVYVSFLLWQITGKLNLALQMPLNKAFPYYSLSYWQITDKLKLSPEWDVFHISSRCCRVKWLNPFFLCCFFYQS